MPLNSVLFELYLGSPHPSKAPLEVMRALARVRVSQSDVAPSGFQLDFNAERYGTSTDYPILATGLLEPFTRVWIVINVQGSRTVLVDGFIVRQEVTPAARGGYSRITVTGEDLSVKMDMIELSTEYPEMSDTQIARQILDRYSGLSIEAQVSSPANEVTPAKDEYAPQQNTTDRKYLAKLAKRNGFRFYVLPPSSPGGSSTAHWGPPVRTGTPQPALSVNLMQVTNVESLRFDYQGLAPSVAYGEVLDTTVDPPNPVQVSAGSSTRSGSLAEDPALGNQDALASDPSSFSDQLATLATRGQLIRHPDFEVARAQNQAQGLTDLSTDRVVVADGTLDMVRYESVLTAPALVDLRGAGTSYDGTYYVESAQHDLSTTQGLWSYKETFRLSREGVGTTIEKVPT